MIENKEKLEIFIFEKPIFTSCKLHYYVAIPRRCTVERDSKQGNILAVKKYQISQLKPQGECSRGGNTHTAAVLVMITRHGPLTLPSTLSEHTQTCTEEDP